MQTKLDAHHLHVSLAALLLLSVLLDDFCLPSLDMTKMPPASGKKAAERATEKAASSFPAIFRSRIDATRKHWNRATRASQIDKEQFLNSILGPNSPAIDNEWTVDDESWLIGAWDSSSSKPAFQTISTENKHLLRLWKTSCKLLNSSPLSIVSPRHGLVYGDAGVEEPGSDDQCQLWSETFCQILRTLACHSFWRADARNLAAAIQFVTICRSDDRRPWGLASSPSSCEAMQTLRDVISTQRDRHLHDLCTEYQASQIANGRQPSLEFGFYCHLASLVTRPTVPSAVHASPHHPPALEVRVSDLEVVEEALDTFSWGGYPLFSECSMIRHASTCLRPQNAFPRGAELRETHIRSFLHEARLAYRAAFATRSISRAPRQILAPASPSAGHAPTTPPQTPARTPRSIIILDDDSDDAGGPMSLSRPHKPPLSGQIHGSSAEQDKRRNTSRQKNRRRRNNRCKRNEHHRPDDQNPPANRGPWSSPLGSPRANMPLYPDRWVDYSGIDTRDVLAGHGGHSFRGQFQRSMWM
jgi:hypothetical protein